MKGKLQMKFWVRFWLQSFQIRVSFIQNCCIVDSNSNIIQKKRKIGALRAPIFLFSDTFSKSDDDSFEMWTFKTEFRAPFWKFYRSKLTFASFQKMQLKSNLLNLKNYVLKWIFKKFHQHCLKLSSSTSKITK